jgi:outer membrane protein
MSREKSKRVPGYICSALLLMPFCGRAHAQQTALPPAPAPTARVSGSLVSLAAPGFENGQTASPISGPAPPAVADAASSAQPADLGPRLTLAQAEQMAIRDNPRISVARLLALAQAQVTREVQSTEMPLVGADLEAVGAHHDSRITGGGSAVTGGGNITSSRILDKAAAGLTVSQLITDFGHTHNLVLSARSNANAQLESERATELDIKLTVDQAYYQALTAQAVLKVAEQTVAQRQATVDQVGALTKAKIKSDLDLSFANVQIAQANLLLLDARNNQQVAMAALNDVLGSESDQQYTLVDETGGNLPPAPDNPDAMTKAAFTARPDLASLNDKYISARQYATAERDLWMPTISAMTLGGGAPVRDDLIESSWYFGAGADVSIPVFNGFLFNADEKEAKLRAQAAQENVRDLRDTIARDVRTAVLNAQTAFERIGVTQGELNQANLALDLAQARYKIGLSSIVELTQAQLAQTQAEIDSTTARYAYQTALAEVQYQLGQ